MGLVLRLILAVSGTLAAWLVPPDMPNHMILQGMFALFGIVGLVGLVSLFWNRR